MIQARTEDGDAPVTCTYAQSSARTASPVGSIGRRARRASQSNAAAMPAMCSPLIANRCSVPVVAKASFASAGSKAVRPSIVAASIAPPSGSSHGRARSHRSSRACSACRQRAKRVGGASSPSTRPPRSFSVAPCERSQASKPGASVGIGVSPPAIMSSAPSAGQSPCADSAIRRRKSPPSRSVIQPSPVQPSPSFRGAARSMSTGSSANGRRRVTGPCGGVRS